MKMIFPKIAVFVVLCTPALANGPVAWTDRCYAEAQVQKGSPPTPEKITPSHCFTTIINYCSFSLDSSACLLALQSEFERRTNGLLAALPKSINGPSFKQRMYQKRLEVQQALSTARPCDSAADPLGCTTTNTMMAHQILESLSNSLSNAEENK